jgi:O-antigen/teichoic acid export membrane protein
MTAPGTSKAAEPAPAEEKLMWRMRRRGNGFLNQAMLGAGSIAAGQMLLLLSMPLLARRFSPSEFGIYASLVALSSIIGTAASLRTDMALPATLDEESHRVYKMGMWACATSFVAGLLIIFPGLHAYLPWPNALSAVHLALLCLATGCLQGLMAVFSAALVRSGRFRSIAILRLLQPGVFVGAALLPWPGDLTLAYAASLIATASAGLLFSRTCLSRSTGGNAASVIRKYWEYPVISLPVAVLDTLTLSMPLLFIMQYYGEAAGGNYSQIQRLATAPLMLCTTTVAQVFFKHAGDLARQGDPVRGLMWKTVSTLAAGGALLTLAAALAGSPLLTLFLGKNWRTDAAYLVLILTPAVCRLCVSPITCVFLLTGNIRLQALWQVTYAVVMWCVLSVAAVRVSLDQFLLAVLVSEAVLYALYLWMANIAVRRLERKTSPCAA